jgi:uncharacterized protein YkvS
VEAKMEIVQHVSENSVIVFVEYMYKMQLLRDNSVPVLYIGCTVAEG